MTNTVNLNSAMSLSRDDATSFGVLPRFSRVQMPEFELHNSADPQRPVVERYIHDKFLQAHNASVNHFLPSIITLSCHDSYSAAVGLSPAAKSSLFAERYLQNPIEQEIANKLAVADVSRDEIVEIGNLVSTWSGSSALLFVFLSELIDRLGYRYVMFTATQEVEQLLSRMHYEPITLTDAKPECLEDGGASWGSYYAKQPHVMVGDVHAAIVKARENRLYRATAAVISAKVDAIAEQFYTGVQSSLQQMLVA
jgi:hypothetical protein